MSKIDKLQRAKDSLFDAIQNAAFKEFTPEELEEAENTISQMTEEQMQEHKQEGLQQILSGELWGSRNRGSRPGGLMGSLRMQNNPAPEPQDENSPLIGQSLGKWCDCIEDIEYADEDIINNLKELMRQGHEKLKERLKKDFTTLPRGERVILAELIKFIEALQDILENGRYVESDSEVQNG